MQTYPVRPATVPPNDLLAWEAQPWSQAETLQVDHFRPESSSHRPRTQARFLYDAHFLYGLFTVDDRYVRSVHTRFQSPTHLDSCVEVFLQPKDGLGYFNFEFNAGGTLAVFYISDATRTENLFQDYVRFSPEQVTGIQKKSSLPAVVEPEIVTPITWRLGFALPLAALELFCGPLGMAPGIRWRANVYKCADECSHPHWAAWSPVPALNFHLPQAFGEFQFV